MQTLTDDECDKIAAQTIDRVAAEKGLAHGLELNTDIAVSHTLRRELVRAGAAVGLPAGWSIRAFQAAHDKAWWICLESPDNGQLLKLCTKNEIRMAVELHASTQPA